MITNFNDFTLNHTTSHHQLSPDAEEEHRIKCLLCEDAGKVKDFPNNNGGKNSHRGHVAGDHWGDDKDKLKGYVDSLFKKDASTPQAQLAVDKAKATLVGKINEKRR
jgi:hypothetical protein